MAIVSFIVSIFTFIASFISPYFETSSAPENKADDFVPVMRFVAASDTHIQTLGDVGCQRLSKMINAAYTYAENDNDYKNIDAFTFSGDITDNGFFSSFAAFTAITDNEIRQGTERLAVVSKAHDSYTFGYGSLNVFSKMTNQEADFHKVINGFHFIGISRSDTIFQYTKEQVEWLDKNIAEAVKENPDKPVFVFQHEHVLDTVYGSSKTDGWGLDTFSEVLNKYPQVVHISGHSHFPANDPRAIWQDTFTALNTGGLAYFELAVDGKNGQFPDGNDTMTQALIIEVDAQNRVLVKVFDVDAGKIIREFLIDNIGKENKTKYNPEYRKENSSAPVFSENAELKTETKNGKIYITTPEAKVSGDNEVFVYRFVIKNANGKEVHNSWKFSEYYFSEMPESITSDGILLLLKGTYTVSVFAEDVWGNISAPITTEISI